VSKAGKIALLILSLVFFLAWAWWFLTDEALDAETARWLEKDQVPTPSQGLDYLFLMGLMAPVDEDPIEYALDLTRQVDPVLDQPVDYLPELMRDSPCDIDDWDCWAREDSLWVANTLASYEHVLGRWHSLPVHHDFGEEPLSWLFRLALPALEALDYFLALQLVAAKHSGNLDELALQAFDQAARLASARPNDGNILSLLFFESIRERSIRQLFLAIRLGAEPPSSELIEQNFAARIVIEDHLSVWARRELSGFRDFRATFQRGLPDFLLASKNRTLNRARECLEQAFPLADESKLLELMESESELCGPAWRSWRNWRGDDLIHLFFMAPDSVACRVHGVARREHLAKAILHALIAYESESQRLTAIGRANPYHPDAGAFLKGEQVCFDLPAAACGEVCLPAPWSVNSLADH